MSYLKDREVWLPKTPTGNPPAGYFWKFIQDGVVVVRDSDGVDKKMAHENQLPIPIDYLVIGGGGGGGAGWNNGAGGGGAGGYIEEFTLFPTSPISITVGAGGAANNNASPSIIGNIVHALGGGAGGPSNGSAGNPGNNGASGGGGSTGNPAGGSTAPLAGGLGVHILKLVGQGRNGGASHSNASNTWNGGGGGGASADGTTASFNVGGNGGAGRSSTITGSSVTRAGGGGGRVGAGTQGVGGAGGGGNGNAAATANTGGGGGGSAAGGSGVIILRYPSIHEIIIGVGLTASTAVDGAFKVTTFTAGSDTIEFNLV